MGAHWTNIFIKEYNSMGGLAGNIYNRGAITQQKIGTKTLSQISLPIPLQLLDNNTVTYNAENLSDALKEEVSNIGKDLGGASLISTGAKILGASAGLAQNEFLTMLFKGPTYKKFNIAWKLSPKNATESQTLNKLLITLKNAQAPSINGAGFLFNYPKVFWISFKYKSSDNNYLYKFKPAMLETLMVNYSGGGIPGFYKDTGAPESVIIDCAFTEVEFWLDGDFNV